MNQGTSSPLGERDRLAVLDSYNILDTPPEAGFDDIVMLARMTCNAPIALISLVSSDRQWFKACVGLDASETPLDRSVCKIELGKPDLLIIPDLTLDARTADNGHVTGEPFMRFYAGAPLVSSDGFPLGRVCVIDTKPRPNGLTTDQAICLEVLARQVMTLLELRRSATVSEDTSKLRASEDRMRLAQQAGHVGSFDVDLTTDIITVTEQFCAIFGLPVTASLPSAVLEAMLHPDDRRVASDRARRSDGTTPLDVEYRIRRADNGEERWIARRGQFAFDDAGRPTRLLGTVQDITHRKDADARQKILNDELSHRLKNTLALVQAIARQTLRDVSDLASVRAFEERINALSNAHDILLKQSWTAADLRELISGILELHGDRYRFRLTGPDMSLGARAALSFSMLLHELATNAHKYGALSVPAGHVEVRWSVVDKNFVFEWTERGGPPVVPPTRTGFGSRLIDMGMMGTSDTTKSYEPDGFEVRITTPLDSVKNGPEFNQKA